MAETPNPIPARAADELLADLAPLGDVMKRAMFGGYGLFANGTMFAMIDTQGTQYLRADDDSSHRFIGAGSDSHGAMPYWTIPPAVRDSHDDLVDWATEALAAATRAKK